MYPYIIEELSDEKNDIDMDKEHIILESVHAMKNDRQRVVFFFEILREYGYQLDCESIAKSMGIERRWYQRVKQGMRKLVKNVI
jgi:hypothetical protein